MYRRSFIPPESAWIHLAPGVWWTLLAVILLFWVVFLRVEDGRRTWGLLFRWRVGAALLACAMVMVPLRLYLSRAWAKRSGRAAAEMRYPTTRLTVRYLWDPLGTDLEDWQVLDRPTALAHGAWDDLLIVDSANARVVRVDESTGRLIGIIGRAGRGPGEFGTPQDIAFERKTNILWVTDRSSTARVSRFRLTEAGAEFLDSFRVPSLIGDSPGTGLVPAGSKNAWVSPRISSGLLHLVGEDGHPVEQAGTRWEPEGVPEGAWWIRNQGFLTCTRGWMFFAWMFRPRIDVFSLGGESLLHREFTDLPEFEGRQEEKLPADTVRAYMLSLSTSPRALAGIIQVSTAPGTFVFYTIRLPTLTPVARLVCELNDEVDLRSAILDDDPGRLRIFALDVTNGGVLVLEKPL